MKKKEEKSQGFFGMGVALLLTVFLVLMLVTFSLLSLASARNDLNRCRTLADRRTEYYEANNQAEKILQKLRQGEDPEYPIRQDSDTVEFEVLTTNDQVLYVNLRLHQGKWQILRWEITSKTA